MPWAANRLAGISCGSQCSFLLALKPLPLCLFACIQTPKLGGCCSEFLPILWAFMCNQQACLVKARLEICATVIGEHPSHSFVVMYLEIKFCLIVFSI